MQQILERQSRPPSRLMSQRHSPPIVAAEGDQPFELAPLPYTFDALEPFIDQETIRWHYENHHHFYVQRLNEALRGRNVAGHTLEDLLSRVSRFPPDVRSNGGGHWNHTFFWNAMTDCMEDQEIPPLMLRAIESSFQSFERFKDLFVEAGVRHLGSGWIWLLKTGPDQLRVVATSNQDNPLMDVVAERGSPILVCDLWEHAYYLRFKSRRDEFLRRFLAVVNWARACSLYSDDLD